MAVLTRDAILRELELGRVVIEPLEPAQIGPASIDLTLGEEIRVLTPGGRLIPIREGTDYREYTTPHRLDGPFVLDPGLTIHAITRERVTLPTDLCGFLEGRSQFARLGLMIHVTAAFVQPGVSNRQVLEMSNVSGHPLEIHAGVRLCQLVLMRTEGHSTYRGRFAEQEHPQRMRAVAQRVRSARIEVSGACVGEMQAGLLALVGVCAGDDEAAARELARRLAGLRVFDDAAGRMNRSLLETGGTLGVVSQFTLLGDARSGRRPSYVQAASAAQAEPLIEALCEAARALSVPVVTGRFGAEMQVHLVNDGPVTLLLDTAKTF